MDTLLTSMVLLVGGLLAIALLVAGWEAMQRSVTEQLAREAWAANAEALERPFIPSEPSAETLAVPTAADRHAEAAASPSEGERRRALVQQTLEQAAHPAAPVTRPAPNPGPHLAAWPDTVPMTQLTLPPERLDSAAIEAAKRRNPQASVVAERALDLELH
jgi:hypothetical protein